MRKKDLKHATTGVVITVVLILVLLGILRARQPGAASAQEGAVLFVQKGCTHCHYADSEESRKGPGLKGLFDREQLPVSGRPVSEENVRDQLKTPYENMPSFSERLTKEERDRLIAYLKTL